LHALEHDLICAWAGNATSPGCAAPDAGKRPAQKTIDGSRFSMRHRKQPFDKQHFLKQPPRTTGTGVVPPQLFNQVFVAMHDAQAALDLGF
jgi:hypothetical protein